ncbi:MAG: hypothetical protein PGN34_17355 [Methylobacterium frigidaeris]
MPVDVILRREAGIRLVSLAPARQQIVRERILDELEIVLPEIELFVEVIPDDCALDLQGVDRERRVDLGPDVPAESAVVDERVDVRAVNAQAAVLVQQRRERAGGVSPLAPSEGHEVIERIRAVLRDVGISLQIKTAVEQCCETMIRYPTTKCFADRHEESPAPVF